MDEISQNVINLLIGNPRGVPPGGGVRQGEIYQQIEPGQRLTHFQFLLLILQCSSFLNNLPSHRTFTSQFLKIKLNALIEIHDPIDSDSKRTKGLEEATQKGTAYSTCTSSRFQVSRPDNIHYELNSSQALSVRL